MSTIQSHSKPRPRRARGRPSKYTPKVVKVICAAIADGVPFKFAAALGGISQDTFCEWQRRFSEFSEAIERATARGVLARLEIIKAAAEGGDVKAAQWYLEHIFPEHFARNRIELKHDISGRLAHEIVVSPQALDAIAESRKRYELARANG